MPDPRVKKLATQNGIALGRIRARQVTPAMIQSSDYILVMEHEHLDDLAKLITSGELPENVQLLGGYLPRDAGGNTEIPDPYFGDWHGFLEVFDRIDAALTGLVGSIEERLARQ